MNRFEQGFNPEQKPKEPEKRKSALDKLGSFAKKHPTIYSSILLLGTLGASKEGFAADNVAKKVPEVQHTEKIENGRVEFKNPDEYEKSAIAYLEGKIPNPDLWALEESENFDEAERSKRIQEALKNPISIEGFDSHSKLNKKDILSLIQSMPPGWQANFRKIEHLNENEEVPDMYGAKQKRSDKLLMPAKLNLSDRTVTFYPDAEKLDANYYRHTIRHEGSHLNWILTNNFLTRHEKITLLMAVIKRLGEKDRFKAQEVEKISNPNDPQEELLLKAYEYFAEISASMFDAQAFVPKKDEQIAKWVLGKIDPKYDRNKLLDMEKKIAFIPDADPNDKQRISGVLENK